MKVLFLTHRLPYAPNRGDRIRAYYLLQEMSRWAEVSLFSLVHDDDEAVKAAKLTSARPVVTARVPKFANGIRGALRLASRRPLTHSLLDAPGARDKLAAMVSADRPDVVLAYCSGMARFALQPPLSGLPLVLDMVDVDSEKWAGLARRAPWPRSSFYSREVRTLSAFERVASERARAVLVVSEHEREVLSRLAPDAAIRVVSNGVDASAFHPPETPSDDPVVVFTGMMDYPPNVQAVTWFVGEVWPRILAARPDARFTIVGANPTRAVKALADRHASVDVTGRVDAVQTWLWRGAVAVAPLLMARGVQNKVLESLAAGLPVVTTSAVRAGLPPGIENGCSIADEPEAFAAAVVALLEASPDERRARAAAALVERLTWEAQLSAVRAILENAMAFSTTLSDRSIAERFGK